MTDRIERMKKRLEVTKFPLCIERLKISMDELKRSEGLPTILQRARVNAAVLDRLPIHINDDELIVGDGASKPFGIEMEYEYGVWTKEEVESLKSERYTIDPEDEETLYELLKDYGCGKAPSRTLTEAESEVLGEDERMWNYVSCGVNLPPWNSRKGDMGGGCAQSGLGLGPGFDLFCIDYRIILEKGARSVIDEAKKCLANATYHDGRCIERKRYWETVVIIFEAWVRFANRYADLAGQMAETEADPVRKAELLDISARCRRVPEFPAENFRDAVQAFWFTFLMVLPSPTASMGRLDQFLYPMYKKDKEIGAITDEEVLELLETIRIKDFQMNRVSGKANREKNSGMAKWHNATIGGVKSDGSDAANELTSLVMLAAKDLRIPHHTCTLRVHENTSIDLIVEGLKTVRVGVGMPAFVSDKSYINFFESKNCAVEDAREYVMCGCLDPSIPGVTRGQTGNGFNIAKVYDIFLHSGYSSLSKRHVGFDVGDVKCIPTFEEHKAKFYEMVAHFVKECAERTSISFLAYKQICPNPFRSALMKDGVSCGQEMMDRTFLPFEDGCRIVFTGGINVADSLVAVKKLVYDEKKYTMGQLLEALDANWVGFEDMRKDFVNAPKYGNDINEADEMAADLYHFFVEEVEKHDTPAGGKMITNAISIAAHQPGGMVTGALPDGKYDRQILADGSISPVQGKDCCGPLAVFRSGMKINQDEFAATLLNMKFPPNSLKTEEDLKKLASAIKAYLTHGGKHVQFTVVDPETLEDAIVHPEDHKDLIVRVAGYSAYFTVLSKGLQKEVMDRTTQSF